MNVVTPLGILACQLGEGPLWHPGENRLYCVDIESKQILRINLQQGSHESYRFDQRVSCLGIREQGGFVLAAESGFAFWEPASNNIMQLCQPEVDRSEARFNDGAVDPCGRFWAGSMTPEGYENSLYRLDPDLTCHPMQSGIGIANGIGWSPDRRTMYFTDSPRKVIHAFDYDVEAGSIENQRIWADLRDERGVPDGLTVDVEGCVWSARWDGWCVSRFDPQGQLMTEIQVPVQRPTSCTFAGEDLDLLCITSARVELTEQERREQPSAGDLFLLPTETRGQTPNLFLG
jgi:sugar lactone lactonase YvrE